MLTKTPSFPIFYRRNCAVQTRPHGAGGWVPLRPPQAPRISLLRRCLPVDRILHDKIRGRTRPSSFLTLLLGSLSHCICSFSKVLQRNSFALICWVALFIPLVCYSPKCGGAGDGFLLSVLHLCARIDSSF